MNNFHMKLIGHTPMVYASTGAGIAAAAVLSAGAAMYSSRRASHAARDAADRQLYMSTQEQNAANDRFMAAQKAQVDAQNRSIIEGRRLQAEQNVLRTQEMEAEQSRFAESNRLASERDAKSQAEAETRRLEQERVRKETRPMGETATVATTSKRKKTSNATDLLIRKAPTSKKDGVSSSGLGFGV